MNVSQKLMIRAAMASDKGKMRPENQDACLVDLERQLFILADGMGGHQGGKQASNAVVSVLPEIIRKRAAATSSLRPRIAELILQESIVELSRSIREQGAGRDGLDGLGATVALAWVPTSGAQAHLAHVGDSRIYRFRGGRLEQLTEDHTLLALLIKHGEVRPEDAGRHPARSQLSRYVGMGAEGMPDVMTIALEAGDRLLLCSDGLTKMTADERIAGILGERSEPEEACSALVAAANEAGGKDNISVIVADIGVH